MQDRKYIQYDLKDFINKKKNILFITGYSGSGKSTLAKDLGKRYDATSFSLDNNFRMNINWLTFNRTSPENALYFKLLTNSGLYQILNNDEGSIDSHFYHAPVAEKCAILIKQAIKDCSKTNRIIIEGVQLYQYESLFNLFINQPLLIMDVTSKKSKRSDEKRKKESGVNFIERMKMKPQENEYYGNQEEIFNEFLMKVKRARGESK